MLKPLEQFICDTCNETITNVNEGWIEWERTSEKGGDIVGNFRICHHTPKCQTLRKSINLQDLPLREVSGEKVHAFLYKFLDVGPYHQEKFEKHSIKDLREYVELMRRLTIPYYEEARQFWNKAMEDGYFGDSNEVYIYIPENLKNMIKNYSTN